MKPPTARPKDARERDQLRIKRKKIRRIIEALPSLLEEIAKLSNHPERDYARIFQDEASYFRMIEVCKQKYDESFKASSNIFTSENAYYIQAACVASGMKKVPSGRQLLNRHFREKVIEKLKTNRTPDGITLYEQLIQRMQHDKYSKTNPYRRPHPNTASS